MTDAELAEQARALLERSGQFVSDQFAFRGAQYDAGLAWVHFPQGRGGLGLGRGQQSVVDDVLRAGGVPYHDLLVNPIGIGMGAPTVLAFGTEEMHATLLRPIFTGEDIWCQLFSEPTHGSDVAGITSRAVRDGDEWVVNGQKVWTTLAHVARYGMLLARTNPDIDKYAGLTYFVLDMQSPGVEVRPLFQLTGEAEFNEVFLTDVRIPEANLLGGEGDGWRVALTTLMNERVALGGGSGGKNRGPVGLLLKLWAERRDDFGEAQRAVLRDRVADLWVRSEVLRMTNRRARATARHGAAGPEGSVGKLASAELNQAVYEMCLRLAGPDGLLHPAGYPMTRADQVGAPAAVSSQFLRSRANTIEGGTSEVMRNILGERVLGLPGDTRADKGIPWSQIPR